MGYTKDDIRRIVKEEDIRFIRLQFTDILGTQKSVAITIKQLEKALSNECMFDGSSIEGFVRIEESDMYLYPDLDTFMVYPWTTEQGKMAKIICDVYSTDKKPFEGDPRYRLRKVLDEAKEMGYTMNVGPECEFFLFKINDDGTINTNTTDTNGYFDLGAASSGDTVCREICLALEKSGFEIEASHHEVAPSQFEIDFKYSEALKAADNIVTFKTVVKHKAKVNGYHATFMPKPIFGEAGSGMHINISLFKDGKNVFFDETSKTGLSKTAEMFIAGVLKHTDAITAICNPTVNSYKRLVPNYEAPCYIAWSTENRSPLVRIPASRGLSTRMELRSPDPSSNPYLAITACLAAGLDGIKNKLTPPEPVDQNLFAMSDAEREEKGIKSLPKDLYDALLALENDDVISDAMGEHIMAKYLTAKRQDWAEYTTNVTEWEKAKYLKAL
jgi:glutamine synthetase